VHRVDLLSRLPQIGMQQFSPPMHDLRQPRVAGNEIYHISDLLNFEISFLRLCSCGGTLIQAITVVKTSSLANYRRTKAVLPSPSQTCSSQP
jgi:hypothetical protein